VMWEITGGQLRYIHWFRLCQGTVRSLCLWGRKCSSSRTP